MYNPFDLNKNGKLDGGELFLMASAMLGFEEEQELEEQKKEAMERLELYDLDYEELLCMDEDEREAIFEDNYLDPEDFTVLFDD